MVNSSQKTSERTHPDLLKIVAILYLSLPVLIFVLGYCRWYISIPFTLVESWILVRIVQGSQGTSPDIKLKVNDWLPALLILVAWVLLSGIGGYMFQNGDYDTRNAIFRDLIQYDWPIIYQQTAQSGTGLFGLVYYTGFWLPAVLVGKLLGWQAANFALFLWSLIGIFIVVALIRRKIKTSFIFTTSLLIMFSGMDFLGKILVIFGGIQDYPSLWPPISHLEFWSAAYQYSSNTTQLFWVFNQSIPCWVVISLYLAGIENRHLIFLWSLGFFLSPISLSAFLPFLLLQIYQSSSNQFITEKVSGYLVFTRLIRPIMKLVSLENLVGGGLVTFFSVAYFSSNPNGTQFTLSRLEFPRLFLLFFFITFDFLLLWLVLLKDNKRDLYYYLAGLSLLIIPFFKIGKGYDFPMRASIPALFLLMVWSGEALRKPSTKAFKTALIVLLAIGAITPIYEINRSVYRTVKYYVEVRNGTILPVPPDMPDEPVPFPPEVAAPELVHPSTLTADEYQTMTYFDLETLGNYAGRIENSFFFKYLAKPR